MKHEQNKGIQNKVLRFLTGDFMGNGCPAHPAFVHLPIVLIPLAAGLKAGAALGVLPSAPGSWPWSAAHFVSLLALLSLIPTALTGAAEYIRLPKGDPRLTRKVQLHSGLNTVVALITLYLYVKCTTRANHIPTQGEVILGLFSVGILLVSGHVGGELVFEHGVGVKRQGKSRK